MSYANHNNGSASGLIWKLMIAPAVVVLLLVAFGIFSYANLNNCLLYTSDAADE